MLNDAGAGTNGDGGRAGTPLSCNKNKRLV